METNVNNSSSSLYPVRCTECGELIETKIFPMDKLLEQYHNGQEDRQQVRAIVKMLGISAEFGKPILPDVPALFDEKGKLVIPEKEVLQEKGVRLQLFHCKDNEVPEELLLPVNLNMASMVAQFAVSTGFYEIYTMLSLISNDAGNVLGSKKEQASQHNLDRLCDSLAALPCVSLSGEMTNLEDRRAEICDNLRQLLIYARTDAAMMAKGEKNAAMEQLYAGWRYKMVNSRRMPFSLVIRGSNGNIYDIEDCRCPNCRHRISHKMGAYRQKIVGLLGTQATGKTTYLAALTDAIQTGEATSLVKSNGDVCLAGLTIQPCTDNDPQWERMIQQPRASADLQLTAEDIFSMDYQESVSDKGGDKAGSLWLYQNGFPPEKTKLNTLDASALTFLVSPIAEQSSLEPVMYTLADIPGEAFFDWDQQEDSLVKIQHKLLFSCSAIIMVVSARQLLQSSLEEKQENAQPKDKLVNSPSDILAAYEKFLPDHSVPTAVVLTSSDEINGGDLRAPMHLAWDLRKCRPLMWSQKKGALVYNAMPMHTEVEAVWSFLNSHFGLFTENLANVLRRGGQGDALALAAFAVSNGTQFAKKTYSEMRGENPNDDDAGRQRRYQLMRKGRFGVTSPILWLLAMDGMLDAGCGAMDDADPAVTEQMRGLLNGSLRQS